MSNALVWKGIIDDKSLACRYDTFYSDSSIAISWSIGLLIRRLYVIVVQILSPHGWLHRSLLMVHVQSSFFLRCILPVPLAYQSTLSLSLGSWTIVARPRVCWASAVTWFFRSFRFWGRPILASCVSMGFSELYQYNISTIQIQFNPRWNPYSGRYSAPTSMVASSPHALANAVPSLYLQP